MKRVKSIGLRFIQETAFIIPVVAVMGIITTSAQAHVMALDPDMAAYELHHPHAVHALGNLKEATRESGFESARATTGHSDVIELAAKVGVHLLAGDEKTTVDTDSDSGSGHSDADVVDLGEDVIGADVSIADDQLPVGPVDMSFEALRRAPYLKNIDRAIVQDDLAETYDKGFFKRRKAKKNIKALLRHLAVEKAGGGDFFINGSHEAVMYAVSHTDIIAAGEGVPYTQTSLNAIANYFRPLKDDYERAMAVMTFNQAFKEMKRSRDQRNIYQIVRGVEEAAEVGYVPAILAYGVMNRYGLFGLHKNMALAEAFFRMAAAGGSGYAMGYLADMREQRLVYYQGLKGDLITGHDRNDFVTLLRAASITTGNWSDDFGEHYQAILWGNLKREQAVVVGHYAKEVVKVGGVVLEKAGEIGVKALVKGITSGAA